MDSKQMSDKRATDNKSQKEDRRQIMRAKQLFSYRVQRFKTSYGPTVARQVGQRPSSNLSVDSLMRESADQGLVSPQQKIRKPQLPELMAKKQTLSQELQATRQTAEQINQITMKNMQLNEKQEMQVMKDTLYTTMSSFNTIKESLLLSHKDLERQWKGLVGTEAREAKEKLRKQIDALQIKLNAIVGEQKGFMRDFQDHYKQLTNEFQHVKNKMEASDKLIREKQQQSKEHQALVQKFNTLVQKVKDMEENLKTTRTKFQQVQASLVSNQKVLAETAEEKMKLECELDSMKGEWTSQENLWGVEKNIMAEDIRNEMASRNRTWMKERDELVSEQKAIAEHLLTAQNRGTELDDELTATKVEMQDQRKTLREKEKTLEKSTSDNKKLKDDVAEKEETLFKFRKNIKAKDTEINELRNEVRELTDELDRLLNRKKKKFTLMGVIKKSLGKTVDKPINTSDVDKPINTSDVDKPINTSDVDKPINTSDVDKPINTSDVDKPINTSDV